MTLRERIEARLALAEAAGEHELSIETGTPQMSGANWYIRFVGQAGIRVSAHEYDHAYPLGRLFADRNPAAVIAECRADLALLTALNEWTPRWESGESLFELSPAGENLLARYPEVTP